MKKHFNLEEWEEKRKKTVRVFIFQCLLLGMEYSVTFLTLWIYITTLVKTSQPKIFYSFISASYLLSAVVFSIIIGRWVDKTRNIRITFFVCNTFVIIGNLVYAVHHSPWFLVVGRFLCGIGGPLRSVVSGEVSRCFPTDQMMNKFSAMGMAFSLGFIMGPGVNFIFKDVNFKLLSIHVTFANIPGFYMAGLFLIIQITVIFSVHDLSKEFDLKAFETIQNHFHNNSSATPFLNSLPEEVAEKLTEEMSVSRDDTSLYHHLSNTTDAHKTGSTDSLKMLNKSIAIEKVEQSTLFPQTFTRTDAMLSVSVVLANESLTQHSKSQIYSQEYKTPKIKAILSQIVDSFDASLVFFLSFSMYFWMVAFDMWLPMMVIDVLHMGFTELNCIDFGFGCISAIVLLFLSYMQLSDKTLFDLTLFCVFALAIMEVIFASMKLFPTGLYVNITLWVIWGFLFAIVVIMDEVFLISILAKMTSSQIQTFNESLRLSMTRGGALLALTISAMLFDYVEYMCLIGVIFAFVVLCLLLARRKTLQAPSLIIK